MNGISRQDRTVVLLNPPGRGLHIRDLYCSITSKSNYYWPPIDLVIQSGFFNRDFKVVVIDAMVEKLSPKETMRRVIEKKPYAVLSMVGSASLPGDVEFLRILKRELGCWVAVSGDVCVDAEPWLLRENECIDIALLNFVSPDAARFLSEPTAAGPFPGIAFRKDGDICSTKMPIVREFSYPVPRHDLFPLSRYRLPFAHHYPFTTVLANYGCPFSCSYCIQNKNVLTHATRSISNIAEELEFLSKMGVREIYFRDPLFEANPQRARELCELLKKYRFSWSCNCRVNTLSDSLAELMKESGCHCIAFGFETADERVLKNHEKPITIEQSWNAVRICKKHRIQIVGYFILGLPGENRQSVAATIDFALKSGIDFASFSAPSPDYGTKLREQAVQAGKIRRDFRTFNRSLAETSLTDDLSIDVLDGFLRRAMCRFYVRPLHLSRLLLRVRSFRQVVEILSGGWAILRNYFLAGRLTSSEHNVIPAFRAARTPKNGGFE